MEKLFDDTLLIQNERPTKITKQQEEQMFIDLAEEVIKNQYTDEDDVDTIVEDLKQLSLSDSGFEKAKDLDSNGSASYSFDGDFIDWLDNMDYKKRQILNDNIKLWVKAHNPTPKFEKGQRLIVDSFLNHEKTKGTIVFITGLDIDRATYHVDTDPNRNGGTVIPYERVEKCCLIN
jgi:hypothetical protein